jgi:L-lactate dehydrogenase
VSLGCVEANVVGEHGTSSMFLWSSARIGGTPMRDLLAKHLIEFDAFRKAVDQDVRFVNITIIEGIGASQHGIGLLSARVAAVILRDERAVFLADSYNARFGTTVSLPSVVGRRASSRCWSPTCPTGGRQGLERSAAHLRETVRQNIGAKSDPSRFRPRPVFQYARYALRPAVGARALPHQGIRCLIPAGRFKATSVRLRGPSRWH